MLIEDQRLIHEDLERLEDAVADRLLEDPSHIRDRLARDHEIAQFLDQIKSRSSRLLTIYEDADGVKDEELRTVSMGDPMQSFQDQLTSIRDFHRRYPDEQAENLEKAYKKRPEDQAAVVATIDGMFTGEEAVGRFFDMNSLHEQWVNLPDNQQIRRLPYLAYLDQFDVFLPPACYIEREQKMKSEEYFQYLKALEDYLESFMRRKKPLENLEKIFANFDKEFDELWAEGKVAGWELVEKGALGDGIWCSACKKEFSKETVYNAHLDGKKHKKAVQQSANGDTAATANGAKRDLQRFKERAIAEREFRIKKLAAAMQTERADTKVNVERKAGMTDRERQQELEQLYSETPEKGAGEDHDSDGEDKIYNPLKLPLDWSGKPIPYWLYKLHGLGVEFHCEICGNFIYMGRRAFDKHFNEQRHVHGLRCLGITNSTLFREITKIQEATDLWEKIQLEQKKEISSAENVIQMEDTEGNVMPEKVYKDLEAQGLL